KCRKSCSEKGQQQKLSAVRARVVTKRVSLGELVGFLRKDTATVVNGKRRESALSAFCVFRLFCKGLRQAGDVTKILRFEHDLLGFETDLQGSFRTPKGRAKTLGLSN